jgi:hypothetical protein
MRLKLLARRSSVRAFTISGLLVSTAITTTVAAGMFTAVMAIQKSTAASYHHIRSQIQQARLIDYIARDLRRALTVNVTSTQGGETLNLTIPDYYDASGAARDPVISNGGIVYGSTTGVPISYFKSAGKVLRRANGRDEVLATDVEQFHFDFTDDGKQSIGVSINFVPRYQFSNANAEALRDGTTTYSTTLLRNKRTP